MSTRHDEMGFTLIELLVTVVVIGIAIAPITASIFLGIRTEGDVQARLSQNNGAHLLNSYFGPDAQNALTVAVGASESPDICGSAGGPVGLLLSNPYVKWSAAYFVDPTDARLLRRRECEAGAPVGPPAGSVVIRNLDAARPPTFGCPVTTDCASWDSVAATVHQIGNGGRNPYSTTLRATGRVL